MKRRTPAEVEQDLHVLRTMDAKALRLRWREVLKTEPPVKMQSGFLGLAIAYRLQELAYGGLKPDTLRQLRKYAKASAQGQPGTTSDGSSSAPVASFNAQKSLSPGTRLMREWNGTTEVVEVVEGGFVWRGTAYRTLSAAAVAITGTKWSGPKFFGLLSPKAPNHKRKVGPNQVPASEQFGEAA